MKKIFVVFTLLLFICIGLNKPKIYASTSDSIYYFSDSEIISVVSEIQNSFSNYSFLTYSSSNLENIINTGNCQYLFDATIAQPTNSLTVGNMPPYGYYMDCQIVIELSSLLPNIENLALICSDLKDLGCSIIVIGGFSENDYDSDDWSDFMSSIDYFYQKYIRDELATAIVDTLYSINYQFNDTVFFIDKRMVNCISNSTDFDTVYSNSSFMRSMINEIMYLEGYTGSVQSLLVYLNIKFCFLTTFSSFIELGANGTTEIYYRNNPTYPNESNHSIVNHFYQGYAKYIVSYYSYPNAHYEVFVDDMLDNDAELFLVDLTNTLEAFDIESNIHLFTGDISPYDFYNYYGRWPTQQEYEYRSDPNVWSLICSLM